MKKHYFDEDEKVHGVFEGMFNALLIEIAIVFAVTFVVLIWRSL